MSISARRFFIHILVPLFAGFVIYVLFRKNTWIHYHLIPLGLPAFTIPHSWLSNFFVFNTPDFCWSYSLASSLFIWEKMDGDRDIKYFPALVLLLLIVLESIQYFFPSHFTFDWLDIVAAIIAFFLSYLLNRKK